MNTFPLTHWKFPSEFLRSSFPASGKKVGLAAFSPCDNPRFERFVPGHLEDKLYASVCSYFEQWESSFCSQ